MIEYSTVTSVSQDYLAPSKESQFFWWRTHDQRKVYWIKEPGTLTTEKMIELQKRIADQMQVEALKTPSEFREEFLVPTENADFGRLVLLQLRENGWNGKK